METIEDIKENETWIYYSKYVPQENRGIRDKNKRLIKIRDRNGLILNNRALVYYCLDVFNLLNNEDATQEGMIGLINGVDRFLKYVDYYEANKENTVKFFGVALYHSISNNIIRYYRKTNKSKKYDVEFINMNMDSFDSSNNQEYTKDLISFLLTFLNKLTYNQCSRNVGWDYEEFLKILLKNDLDIEDTYYEYLLEYPYLSLSKKMILYEYRYLIFVFRTAFKIYSGDKTYRRRIKYPIRRNCLEYNDYYLIGKILSSYQLRE